MDLAKIIEEMTKNYVEPYSKAKDEIEFINNMNLVINDNKFVLREYQENFIVQSYLHDFIVVHKARQSGYTTLLLLHTLYILFSEYESKSEDPNKILLVSPNRMMAEDSKKRFYRFIEYFFQDKFGIGEFYNYAKMHVDFISSGQMSHMCSRRYKTVYFDEYLFMSNFIEAYNCIAASMPSDGRMVLVTSEEVSLANSGIDIEELEQITETNNTKYIYTHWYEVPYYNKNLMWKKIEVEPTIDKEGNIKYDKERWNKMISEGWIPTSPKYDEMLKLLGDERAKKELLN